MTGNLCLSGDCENVTLQGWAEDLVNKAKDVANTGVQQATKAATKVASAATDEVKKRAKEAAVIYALNHPNQVRFVSAGSVILTAGAIAGCLALGYMIAKET